MLAPMRCPNTPQLWDLLPITHSYWGLGSCSENGAALLPAGLVWWVHRRVDLARQATYSASEFGTPKLGILSVLCEAETVLLIVTVVGRQ